MLKLKFVNKYLSNFFSKTMLHKTYCTKINHDSLTMLYERYIILRTSITKNTRQNHLINFSSLFPSSGPHPLSGTTRQRTGGQMLFRSSRESFAMPRRRFARLFGHPRQRTRRAAQSGKLPGTHPEIPTSILYPNKSISERGTSPDDCYRVSGKLPGANKSSFPAER